MNARSLSQYAKESFQSQAIGQTGLTVKGFSLDPRPTAGGRDGESRSDLRALGVKQRCLEPKKKRAAQRSVSTTSRFEKEYSAKRRHAQIAHSPELLGTRGQRSLSSSQSLRGSRSSTFQHAPVKLESIESSKHCRRFFHVRSRLDSFLEKQPCASWWCR
jgi:hypothetical protein